MPRKLAKTKEEKTAEEYFPMDKTNLKYAVEKKYKKNILEQDEKELENARSRKAKRKYTKKTKSFSYSPPEITLKKNGYELIITEKPQAAAKIANALGKAKTKINTNGVSYYEVEHNDKKLIVACAVGHLFTLKQRTSGSQTPIFDIGWMPNYLAIKKDFTKRYYDTILKLAKNAGSITLATDYDIEGEVIGLNIVRFICGQEDASRMKFSTLTNSELNTAYETKSGSINWGQALAGEARHYLDWMYGINLSRGLMNAIKSAGSFRLMSIGRVQGPTLNIIVKKEKEIQAFKPQLYWQVLITVKNSHELELKYIRDIFKKEDAEKFNKLKGKTAIAKTIITQQIIPPSPPFDLTTLQTEAYKFYGIAPAKTLQIAQSLYLTGLISYPRTSSQKLPPSIDYESILKKLSKKYHVEDLIKREKPVEGKKSDPAHPSIHPTGEFQILSGDEEKIYNLIAKRFLSLFCEDAVINNKTITAEADGLKFSAKGMSIKKKGWMQIYPTKLQEKEIPDLIGEVKIFGLRIEEKETQPPRRFTPASIISELEKRNLGTKATRAAIIETLYYRGYIKEKSIEATPLGISIIDTLGKYSPIIIDEKLTREFEKDMDLILASKKDLDKKEKKIIDKAKENITEIAENIRKKEKEIGKELIVSTIILREQEREANSLNICPVCKKGILRISYSKKNKKHFIACDKYPECKTTFSLPPNGAIKKAEKICEKCGFQMLTIFRKGKKPWTFCFNTGCETNRERIEEYKKKKEEREKLNLNP